MGALYKGLLATAVICAVLFYPVTVLIMGENGLYGTVNLYLASLVGVLVMAGMVYITEYYTGTQYNPVKLLAKASTTGHGTNIIAGLALSMQSTFPPVILISCLYISCQFFIFGSLRFLNISSVPIFL